jgi:uncharacterized protein YggE
MNPETRHMIVEASRPVRYAAAAALATLALFLLVKTGDQIRRYGLGDNPPINTITVTGTGKSAVVPNIAHISFGVEESATAVADAQASATKRTNEALAAVKSMGIADKDVQTTGYNVQPEYKGNACAPGLLCTVPTKNTIASYKVTQNITLTIRDTAKAGDVLQKLGAIGVQNVSGPDFTTDDDSTVMAEARGKAIEDAKQKANVLAKQLGVSLGSITNFSENGGGYPIYDTMSAKSAGGAPVASPAPNLPVGQDQHTVTVQVTYQIQ